VFLTARLFGEINDSTRRTAQFVEMLHTATLIHDDVIDESDIRRGQATVNAIWGNTTAVLSGDYLLTKAMKILSNPVDLEILQDMLSTVMMMVEGEMMQNGKRKTENGERKTDYPDRGLISVENDSEESDYPDRGLISVERETENQKTNYLDIIERKTARLIRSCCVGGAMSVLSEKTEDRRQKLELIEEFGLNLGLVFQMRDDILDDDDHDNTVIAQRLLPEYLDKALNSLDNLAPWVKDQDILSRLRELTVFCAERNH
jgi:octaprenyl-diphosphate synthase